MNEEYAGSPEQFHGDTYDPRKSKSKSKKLGVGYLTVKDGVAVKFEPVDNEITLEDNIEADTSVEIIGNEWSDLAGLKLKIRGKTEMKSDEELAYINRYYKEENTCPPFRVTAKGLTRKQQRLIEQILWQRLQETGEWDKIENEILRMLK